MEDSTQEWTQLGLFFSKIRALFLILKKGHGKPPPLPPPSCTPELDQFAFNYVALYLKLMN